MSKQPKFSLMGDILSGVIMACTSVPQLIAYAESVGYNGVRGLTTAGLSLLAFGIFTGSPWLNCGVTSLTALMTKSDLDGERFISGGEEDVEYVWMVSAYSLFVGVASIGLAILGCGKLAQHVPEPVRAGFKWGCSIGVLSSAVPSGLLLKGNSSLVNILSQSAPMTNYLSTLRNTVPIAKGAVSVAKILFLLSNPFVWDAIPSVIFIVCTVFVMKGPQFLLPKACPPGMEVILVTIGATLFSMYTNYKGAVVGEIPSMDSSSQTSGIMSFLPINILDIQTYLSTATFLSQGPQLLLDNCFNGSWILLLFSSAVFASINFLSIVTIAFTFETENDIPWSPTRELSAQGVACIVAGLTGSAPIGGSISRSFVSRMTGATSSFASIVTALCWIYFLPYMNCMSATPKAALSAVIVSAVVKGVLVPKDLIQMKKTTDWVVGWGTGIVTALTSPTLGFGFGVVVSVVLEYGLTR